MDPFQQMIARLDPVNFSFTVMTFLIIVTFLAVMWFKVIPWYIQEERPFQRELRAKREQANIELKREELAEQRLMRQALERLGSVSDKISLMLELHDKTARSGIDQILALLRIVLEKQGVPASDVARYLQAPDETSPLRAKLLELLEPPAAKVVSQ